MSTLDFIDMKTDKNVSEIQALAHTIMNAPETKVVSLSELYELSKEQGTVVISDQKMPKFDENLSEESNVLSNLTGEDSVVSDWFVRVVPSSEEAMTNPDSADEREELLSIIRRKSYELIQQPMIMHSVYLTDTPDFNLKIDVVVPEQFPKLLFDTAIHYYPIDDKSSKIYAKSHKFDVPSIKIVCDPDWENEDWMYWKSKAHNETEDEPQRLMMIYDVETNTAFLLGAKTFSEIDKAVKILAWNTCVEAGNGDFLPVNGTIKTITITKTTKKSEPVSTTFLTVSAKDSERSFFGLNSHSNETPAKGEDISVSVGGNSGLVMLLSGQNKKKSIVNFGRNCFDTIDNVVERTKDAPQILSAENLALITSNAAGKKELLLSPILSPNAKIHTLMPQEENDFLMPDYLVLMVQDDSLPPVTMIKDADLITSTWFSYTTECDCCSDLKVMPAGNPDATWDVLSEIDLFNKALKKGKFKLILINTTPYSNGMKNIIDDEIVLSIYMKIAKNEIEWKEWKAVAGYNLPDKGTFKNIKKDFDTIYDTAKFSNDSLYKDLIRDSIEMKIDYLRTIDAPVALITPFYKILAKLA